jgi:hypothetical protein
VNCTYIENVREDPERKKEYPYSLRELRQIKVALPPETSINKKDRTVKKDQREETNNRLDQ